MFRSSGGALIACAAAAAFVLSSSSSSSSFLLGVAAASSRLLKVRQNPHQRRIEIVNESGERLAVDWIDPRDGKPHPFRSLDDEGGYDSVSLDSYVNHTFVFRRSVGKEGDHRPDDACFSAADGVNEDDGNDGDRQQCDVIGTFTVSEDRTDHMVIIGEGMEVVHHQRNARVPPHPAANDLVFRCRIESDTALDRGEPVDRILRGLYGCLERETAAAVGAIREELGFQAEIRLRLSGLLENHTCQDPDMETTKPKEVRTWTHRGVKREVGILHDRPSSQIHVLRDFISREECDAVEAAAAPKLHRGTVADGRGGSRLSENRKA